MLPTANSNGKPNGKQAKSASRSVRKSSPMMNCLDEMSRCLAVMCLTLYNYWRLAYRRDRPTVWPN